MKEADDEEVEAGFGIRSSQLLMPKLHKAQLSMGDFDLLVYNVNAARMNPRSCIFVCSVSLSAAGGALVLVLLLLLARFCTLNREYIYINRSPKKK